VAQPTDPTRSLRSAANRPAIPRKPPAGDSRLAQAAQAGTLNKANTKPGTRGRQAVDRATYLRSQSGRRPGQTAREAARHERADVRTERVVSLFIDDPPRYVEIAGLSRRDVSRAARYDALVSNLKQGRISPAAFQRRVSSWRPIAGHTFVSDPAAALAIVEARRAADQESFVYRNGRAA
jgi:hypothetical protein